MLPEHLLRAWLLGGMILHKVVWEVLKRGRAAPRGPLVVRLAKIAVLAGLVAQTLLPDVLPISSSPSGLRAIGAAIYTVGLATAIAARVQLGPNWSDIEATGAPRDQRLVSFGLYRFVRHPIYTGDLLLLLGLELALNSWLVAGAGVLAAFVIHQAMREERILTASLPGYDAYTKRTWRFIPFVL